MYIKVRHQIKVAISGIKLSSTYINDLYYDLYVHYDLNLYYDIYRWGIGEYGPQGSPHKTPT